MYLFVNFDLSWRICLHKMFVHNVLKSKHSFVFIFILNVSFPFNHLIVYSQRGRVSVCPWLNCCIVLAISPSREKTLKLLRIFLSLTQTDYILYLHKMLLQKCFSKSATFTSSPSLSSASKHRLWKCWWMFIWSKSFESQDQSIWHNADLGIVKTFELWFVFSVHAGAGWLANVQNSTRLTL